MAHRPMPAAEIAVPVAADPVALVAVAVVAVADRVGQVVVVDRVVIADHSK